MFKTNHIMLSILSAAVVAGVSSPASSSEVTAIMSIDIKPYREVLHGFNAAISEPVKDYVFGDLLKKDINGLNKSDLLFVVGSDAYSFVLTNVADKPVVYVFVLNPDDAIRSSRSNAVGINMVIPPYEQFRTLQSISARFRKVGVVYDPSKTKGLVMEAESAAVELGMTLEAKKASTPGEAIKALSELGERVDAIWLVPDTTVFTPESVEYMLIVSFQKSIPLIGFSQKYSKNGVFLTFSFDNEDIGRQAGEIAKDILNGRAISKIPVQRPRKYKYSINLGAAQKMGIKIPENVLRKAQTVYGP